MSQPWLLLDRDDTILDDPGYLSDPDLVAFLPGALEGLQRFAQADWPLVVLTNQSGLGRGYFTLHDLEAVHTRFRELLSAGGVTLAGLYYCPHAPDHGCRCRKPETELAQRAAADLNLSLADMVMVGDKESDLELGRRVGARQVVQISAKNQPDLGGDVCFGSLEEYARSVLG